MGRLSSYREVEERYPTLRIVGAIFAGLGVLLLVAGGLLLAVGLYSFFAGTTAGPPGGRNVFGAAPTPALPLPIGMAGMLAAFWGAGLLFAGLQCLATGALIRLAIHVEENTRAAAQALEKLRPRTEPGQEDAGRIFLS